MTYSTGTLLDMVPETIALLFTSNATALNRWSRSRIVKRSYSRMARSIVRLLLAIGCSTTHFESHAIRNFDESFPEFMQNGATQCIIDARHPFPSFVHKNYFSHWASKSLEIAIIQVIYYSNES